MKARVKSTGVLVDVTPQLNINSQHNKNEQRRISDKEK